ncbi:MAG TPA: hypothetical protein PK595_05820 [Bacteroidota bacterium]|nr:hypothetical protein [Bacteroidota bacterium]
MKRFGRICQAFTATIIFFFPFVGYSQDNTPPHEPPIPIVFYHHQSNDSIASFIQQIEQHEAQIHYLTQQVDSLKLQIAEEETSKTNPWIVFLIIALIVSVFALGFYLLSFVKKYQKDIAELRKLLSNIALENLTQEEKQNQIEHSPASQNKGISAEPTNPTRRKR